MVIESLWWSFSNNLGGCTMRKLLITTAIAAVAAMAASVANATVFTLDSFNVTANSSDPGLVVQIDPILTTPLTFDLGASNPQAFNLFKLYTTESTVNNGEDTVPEAITVNFNFSAPTPNSGASVGGQTFGVLTLGGLLQNGAVTWNGPGSFYWGAGTPGLMTISLNDGTFDKGFFGLSGGERKGLTVKGTFDWARDPTGVPEPATWSLMIGGFGLAGATLRRRKAATA
jgi:hypothetical protein